MKTQCPGPLDEGDARNFGGNCINDRNQNALFFVRKLALVLRLLER